MSTALHLTLKVLYLRSTSAEVDESTIAQLRTVAPDLEIAAVHGSADALAEIRRSGEWHALLVSPGLAQNETLALIASLRRDRTPIAIVPVVDESHQDLFAAAVASGADDVLVRRGQVLVNVSETLARIRQSPHLFPVEQRRRINVLYAGRDALVWNLLDQVPFVKAEKITCGVDGSCPVRSPGASDGSLRADAVVIDEHPGEAHPLQVLKSVKAQASDLPVVVLTSSAAGDIATAALELGADDTVLKTGIFRRRLIATLRRVHQRLELTAQQAETKAREERLRQIVENVPTGITVIAADGAVLAMNAAALRLFGAVKPRDVVGRDFRQLVAPADHAAVTEMLRQVTKGEAASIRFEGQTLDGAQVPLSLQGVVLERDAKGGRGVIASVTKQGSDVSGPTVAPAAELDGLQDSLQRMERHYAELEDVRTKERAAWESERKRLEARLEAAERVASERATLGARLDEVTDELARTSHAFAAERQALELRLQELENTRLEAANVGERRAELESALDTVRDELRQAVEAHALERSGWHAIREELESRVRDVDAARLAEADQTEAIAGLERQIRGLAEALESERAKSAAAREQLERDLHGAREALWSEHNERDQARLSFDEELGRLRQALTDERVSWDASRNALQAAVDSANETADTIRREAAERHDLLEQHLRTAEAALAAERAAWETTRNELQHALDHARETSEAERAGERAAWEATRSELQHALDQARETSEAYHANEAAEALLQSQLEVTRAQLERERTEWETARLSLVSDAERARESASAIADEYDATRLRLEGELLDARAALDSGQDTWRQQQAASHDEHARLVADLQQAHDELATARLASDAAHRAWENDRARLEQDLHAHDSGAAGREELNAQVASLSEDLARARGELVRIEELTAALEAARAEIRHTDLAHAAERSAWTAERQAMETRLKEAEALYESDKAARESSGRESVQQAAELEQLRNERQRIVESLDVLRADYAEVVRALNAERTQRDRDRHEMQSLRHALHQEDQRRSGLEADFLDRMGALNAARERLEEDYASRLRDLESELAHANQRVHRLDEEARHAHDSLHAEYERVAESHNRLLNSDVVAYAVTTLPGELVRCNDGFARLFGFRDAPDAMTRTAGRLFPGLSGRTWFVDRLSRDGHVDRHESCVERLDGRAVRILESATLLTDATRGDAETLVEHILIGSAAGPSIEELQGRRLQEIGALTTAMVPEIETLVATLQERGRDLTRQLEDRRPSLEDAETLASLAAQVNTLVRQLAAFSRRQVRGSAPVDLNDAIGAAEPMLLNLAGEYIAFTTELRKTTALTVLREDLNQLLTSLVTAGRDLLPAGGSLTIATRQDEAGMGDDGRGLGGPVLSVTASGYGVQFPDRAQALELVAQRCGGRLQIGGDPGWMVRFEVGFARCAQLPKPGWDWLAD